MDAEIKDNERKMRVDIVNEAKAMLERRVLKILKRTTAAIMLAMASTKWAPPAWAMIQKHRY
jgi:3-phenylpropionate/cinnamic acid dioxygenase small subunit